MDALIFVDTNILLDFYRVRTGGARLELLDLIEKHKELIITGSQVEMEYKRNRQRVVLDSLKAQKTPDWAGLAPPAFLLDAKPAQMIADSQKTISQQHSKLKKRIENILAYPALNDPVYKVLQRVFKTTSPYNLTRQKKERITIRNRAKRRFILGYPPRKKEDTSIGDSVNWEWIVECAVMSGKHVVVVSRDSDYGVSYQNECFLNDWLRQEFKERTTMKRSLILTDRLAEAFKLVAVPVTPEAEREEQEVLAEANLLLPLFQVTATVSGKPTGVPGQG